MPGVGKLLPNLTELIFKLSELVQEPVLDAAPVDGVPVHAMPMIGMYPRGGASGSSRGFRLAPRMPSGAEVLRARPAVTAGRAYVFVMHFLGSWRRTGRSRCFRRGVGAVPSTLHLD